MRKVKVLRIPTDGPDDVAGLKKAIADGEVRPEEIICVLGKTEGNGNVNDFTRGYATLAYKLFLSKALKISREEVAKRVAFIMSGGTEGVMTPHVTIFAIEEADGPAKPGKRLTAGIAFTRDFRPEEIGRMPMVQEVARAVKEGIANAGIKDPADVHFVQIKCPLLIADRIADARARGKDVVTTDTYESMGFSRGASALGTAVATGEIRLEQISNDKIKRDWSLYSAVASTSAGVELNKCEIIVMGNSEGTASDLVIGHAVMEDAIDASAVYKALKSAGLRFEALPSTDQLERVVNVFAKAEAGSVGRVRERRNTMLDDSDIHHTRSARAVVNAVIASIVQDPMVYVSGGGEHQGPDGGGPIAVIARVAE